MSDLNPKLENLQVTTGEINPVTEKPVQVVKVETVKVEEKKAEVVKTDAEKNEEAVAKAKVLPEGIQRLKAIFSKVNSKK